MLWLIVCLKLLTRGLELAAKPCTRSLLSGADCRLATAKIADFGLSALVAAPDVHTHIPRLPTTPVCVHRMCVVLPDCVYRGCVRKMFTEDFHGRCSQKMCWENSRTLQWEGQSRMCSNACLSSQNVPCEGTGRWEGTSVVCGL